MEFEVGLLCPNCRRVYQAKFDNEIKLDESGATTLHCPKCKSWAALNILTQYKVKEFKAVKKYPPSLIVKPKLVGIK